MASGVVCAKTLSVGVKFLITGQTQFCRYNYQAFLLLFYETAAFWIVKNITSASPLLVLHSASVRLPIIFFKSSTKETTQVLLPFQSMRLPAEAKLISLFGC
jgi:hypothetical protein